MAGHRRHRSCPYPKERSVCLSIAILGTRRMRRSLITVQLALLYGNVIGAGPRSRIRRLPRHLGSSMMNHHRLENALEQVRVAKAIPGRIMKFLSNFTNTYSFGVPVGGPAARILSEIALNQIDRLLRSESIRFCRFADDQHRFCDSYEDAFRSLVFLSERLLQNQGATSEGQDPHFIGKGVCCYKPSRAK